MMTHQLHMQAIVIHSLKWMRLTRVINDIKFKIESIAKMSSEHHSTVNLIKSMLPSTGTHSTAHTSLREQKTNSYKQQLDCLTDYTVGVDLVKFFNQ